MGLRERYPEMFRLHGLPSDASAEAGIPWAEVLASAPELERPALAELQAILQEHPELRLRAEAGTVIPVAPPSWLAAHVEVMGRVCLVLGMYAEPVRRWLLPRLGV